MRRFAVAAILLLCVLLNACAAGVPQEVSDNEAKQAVTEFYRESLELMKTDYEKVIRERCHYESQEKYQLALNNPQELKSFEILQVDRLSDNLWVIETHYVYEHYTFYDVDYVSKIDEAWKLMFGEEEIPASIKKNVVIPEYDRENPDILGKG